MDNQFNSKLADAFELIATILRTLGDIEPVTPEPEPVTPEPEPDPEPVVDPEPEPEPEPVVDPEPITEPDTTAWPSEYDVPHREPQSEDPECLEVARRAGCYDKSLVTETVGGMTIKEDGAVIENLRILGTVRVMANNVTIRNCLIDAGNRANGEEIKIWYGIQNTEDGGFDGLLVEDCEIVGVNSAPVYASKGTFRRLDIHESNKDGIKASGPVLVEECWVHHVGMREGTHADCVQMQDGGSGATFRRNYMDMPFYDSVYFHGAPYKSNAPFIIQTQWATEDITDVTIEENWLRGGSYTIYFGRKTKTTDAVVRNCVVRNNKFSWLGGRDHAKRMEVPTHQTHLSIGEGCKPHLFDGNTWYETAGYDQPFPNGIIE